MLIGSVWHASFVTVVVEVGFEVVQSLHAESLPQPGWSPSSRTGGSPSSTVLYRRSDLDGLISVAHVLFKALTSEER